MLSLHADIRTVVAVASRAGLTADPGNRREFGHLVRVLFRGGTLWRDLTPVLTPEDLSAEEREAVRRLRFVIEYLKGAGMQAILHTYPLDESQEAANEPR